MSSKLARIRDSFLRLSELLVCLFAVRAGTTVFPVGSLATAIFVDPTTAIYKDVQKRLEQQDSFITESVSELRFWLYPELPVESFREGSTGSLRTCMKQRN